MSPPISFTPTVPQYVLTIALSVLSILSGLLYIFIKSALKQHSKYMEDRFQSIKEDLVANVKTDIHRLEEQMMGSRERLDNQFREMIDTTGKIDKSIQALEVRVVGEYIPKTEFKEMIKDLNKEVADLRASITQVDKITRVHDMTLARLDTKK